MLTFRKAEKTEFDRVRLFYYSVIDSIADAEYKPMWEKDIYPTREFLRGAIDRGELWLAFYGEEIAGAMILNHSCNDGYQGIQWLVEAEPEEILVIHTLGVHGRFAGKGMGKEMVREALSLAKEAGMKTVRLDVLAGNLPAEKLYPSVGFQYITTVKMYYEDTDWMDFELFEYPLVQN